MRVSGASHGLNSRQNDKRAQKRKKRGSRAAAGGGEHTGGGALEVNDQKHLTGREVERLIEAIKGSRNEIRDRCLLLQPGRQWNRSLPTGKRQPHRVG